MKNPWPIAWYPLEIENDIMYLRSILCNFVLKKKPLPNIFLKGLGVINSLVVVKLTHH